MVFTIINALAYLFFGAGLAMVALANGLMLHSVMTAISQSPTIKDDIRNMFFFGFAMCESSAFMQLVIFFMKAKTATSVYVFLASAFVNFFLGICGLCIYPILRGFVRGVANNQKTVDGQVYASIGFVAVEVTLIFGFLYAITGL